MSTRSLLSVCIATAVLGMVVGCTAPEADVQAEAGRLEVTTASAESREALESALAEWFNVFLPRAREHAERAVTLDPAFGLARAVRATLATDLSAEERDAEFDRAVADAARASQGELMLAAAMRAAARGQTEEALGLADVAARLMPNDPNVAYFRAMSFAAAERVEPLREVTSQFPDFAPAFNILAYGLWAAGDTAGALESVERYVQLMPSHPNSHDSYAELLQFAGRYDEAADHYRQATSLDETYLAGYQGAGEARLLAGNAEDARAAYAEAAEHAATPAARFNNLAIRATLHIVDGTAQDAVREMMAVAREAEQGGVAGVAATIHRNAALIEALFGNAASVEAHFAKSAELGGADAELYHRTSAIAYAMTGQLDRARAAATRFDEIAAAGTDAQRRNAHEVRAVIAVAQNDLAGARTELEQAGADRLLGRAIFAQALAASGDVEEAQRLKNEILSSRGVAFFDVLARVRARSI